MSESAYERKAYEHTMVERLRRLLDPSKDPEAVIADVAAALNDPNWHGLAKRQTEQLAAKQRLIEHLERGGVTASQVFAAQWPDGLEPGVFYEVKCDDNRLAWLRVLVSLADGDAHVSMMEQIEEWRDGDPFKYKQMPTLRARTGIGGGRNTRTRQALLWLALAIKLDNEENGR